MYRTTKSAFALSWFVFSVDIAHGCSYDFSEAWSDQGCIQNCLTQVLNATSCTPSCITVSEGNNNTPESIECLCKSVPWFDASAKCIYKNCGIGYIQTGYDDAISFCGYNNMPLSYFDYNNASGSPSGYSNSSSGSSSTGGTSSGSPNSGNNSNNNASDNISTGQKAGIIVGVISGVLTSILVVIQLLNYLGVVEVNPAGAIKKFLCWRRRNHKSDAIDLPYYTAPQPQAAQYHQYHPYHP